MLRVQTMTDHSAVSVMPATMVMVLRVPISTSAADPALNNCDTNASCTDDDGSFSCVCNAGYDGDGVECTNIDECADPALNNCSDNATCTDADGSFSCVCNAGYDGDGVECTNIDECADPALNNCDDECYLYR